MMGKQKANKQNLESREKFHRINFLYQGCRTVMTQCPEDLGISNYYSTLMTSVAKKTIVRLEPNVKRTLCKGCSNFLLPGVTARVRLHKKSKQWLVWTCLICHTVKRFYTKRGYKLWCETPEAIVDVIKCESTSQIAPVNAANKAMQKDIGNNVKSNATVCTKIEKLHVLCPADK